MQPEAFEGRSCLQNFLLFKLPASFSTAMSRASPNQTTCGLSNPPQWHCGKSAFGIRAAVACGSGALCVKWKLLSVHCSCNVNQKLENCHCSHKLSICCTRIICLNCHIKITNWLCYGHLMLTQSALEDILHFYASQWIIITITKSHHWILSLTIWTQYASSCPLPLACI